MESRIRLRHVGMFVWDIDGMTRFYQDVLGFTVTDQGMVRGHQVVFLSKDPRSHHQLVLEAGRGPGQGSGFGMQQLSFLAVALDDLRAMLKVVRSRQDVSDIRQVNHGSSWSLYFRDPEENRIEVYLDSPWYVAQPYVGDLDLSCSDEDILRTTKLMIRDDPSARLAADWQREMAQTMTMRNS